MKGVKFRLGNNSKFFMGDRNRNLRDIFPSSSLFSAIINNVSILYGEEEAKRSITMFDKGDISISSLFLGLDFYKMDREVIESTIYFLAKPEALIEDGIGGKRLPEEESMLRRKKVKKINMLSLKALQQLGGSWNQEEAGFDYNLSNLASIGPSLACTKDEVKGINLEACEALSFYSKGSQPHALVNRLSTDAGEFYYQDESVYKYEFVDGYRIEPFMYFLYEGDLNKALRSAINLIVDEGIGGRRSSGMGRFLSNQYVDIDWINSDGAEIYVNLSSYSPLKDELEDLLGYQLEKVDGYIYYKGSQPYRKRSIGIIKEGALMKKRPKGKLVDVTPVDLELKNRIYYNGRSFALGLGGGGND